MKNNSIRKIILIRHGKPEALVPKGSKKKIASSKLPGFLLSYKLSGIDPHFKPDAAMYRALRNVKYVFTSEYRRAIESFHFFKMDSVSQSDPIFNEIGLPVYNCVPWKLCHETWMALMRLSWFMGFTRNCETIHEAKERARKAALLLKKQADSMECVALFGHGVFNYFIKNSLQKMGGILLHKWDYTLWACNEMVFKE